MIERMAHYSLQLPVIQNWSCHNCGGCCREHAITITPEERDRIQSQNWTPADGVPAGQPLFVEEKSWFGKSKIQLAHQPDGACVFLNEQGLCRIHAKFGEPAKPLACRIYPYAFHPAGNELAISLRFSCPSVAANRGKSISAQKQELREMAQLVAPADHHKIPPPRLTAKTQLDWPDTLRIVESLDHTLSDEDSRIAVKLLRGLFWIDLIAKSKFTKIRGERLQELLDLLVDASRIEVPDIPEMILLPSAIGQTQFRLLAGLYARKDTAANVDRSFAGRKKQLEAAVQLTQGKGTLPSFNEELKAIPFEALQGIQVPPTEETEEMLSRYFRVKLQGMHFCGRAYFDVPVIEGFQTLTLMFPVVMWIARWRAASDRRSIASHADVLFALTLADHQYGYSPTHSQWGSRRRVRNLVANEDLQRLIAHYASPPTVVK